MKTPDLLNALTLQECRYDKECQISKMATLKDDEEGLKTTPTNSIAKQDKVQSEIADPR